MLRDVHLDFFTKVAGQAKKGEWFGRLLKPLNDLSQEAAWAWVCPSGPDAPPLKKGGVGCHEPRKMVIPLEYASYNAFKPYDKSQGKGGKVPIEKLFDMDPDEQSQHIDASEIPKIKRLLPYRRGLLYVKYSCCGQSLRVNKVSLMLRYEENDSFEIWKDDELIEDEWLPNKRFRPFSESP